MADIKVLNIDQKQDVFSLVMYKLKDYAIFIKLRLTYLVVFSAATGFVMGVGVMGNSTDGTVWNRLLMLVIGGFLITGSSNGFNQIIERDIDGLMDRTSKRPLPDNRMTVFEAYMLATTMGVIGIIILFVYINPLSAMLGILALVLYTLAYTPLKRKTPFAVLVGAFPGAIPPMLGWVAATNGLGIEALILFAIQFIWQFPHFWSIAWVLDDDYKKAGFKMLPANGGRVKSSAFLVLVYTIGLLPISLLPILFNMSGNIAAGIIMISGIWFIYYAIQLYKRCEISASKKLMYASFIYLPVIQIALIIDKV